VTGKVIALLRNNGIVNEGFKPNQPSDAHGTGLLGRFRLETTGENEGKFNMRRLGWGPLIMNVPILALCQGVKETNTLNRIKY